LDLVILVGHLRLARHQTLDEVHQALLERLAPFALTISRREVLYLFDAYSSLLQAAGSVGEDAPWRAQVEEHGGIILSIDGIQPDKGNETVYLVRDVLTGRVLSADNVTSSETAVIKRLLAPVVALQVPVIGAISDAQESLEQALAELWPTIPHQTCQFHYLREAARPIHDAESSMRTAMRKDIQNKVRQTRAQLARHIQAGQEASEPDKAQEVEQLGVLADYALAIQTALNFDGPAPFAYPGMEGYDALSEIETSLQELGKGGSCEPHGAAKAGAAHGVGWATQAVARDDRCAQRHARLGADHRTHPLGCLGHLPRAAEQCHGQSASRSVVRDLGTGASHGPPH